MYGKEDAFISARQLQKDLHYKEWRNFEHVIQRAQILCLTEGISNKEHFFKIKISVKIGNGAQRKIDDFLLSTYACTLIKKSVKNHIISFI